MAGARSGLVAVSVVVGVGVTVAVALGTAPRTQAEAGRIAACLRLRTADGRELARADGALTITAPPPAPTGEALMPSIE